MTGRLRTAAALGGFALTLVLSALAVGFLVASYSTPVDLGGGVTRLGDAAQLLVAVAFAAVGVVIVLRAGGNHVGWLFLAIGPALTVNVLAEEYAIFAVLARAHPLPGGATAAWVQSWTSGVPVTLGLSLLFLIFPDGNLVGGRWRVVVWTTTAGFLLVLAGSLLIPDNTTEAFSSIRNPYTLESARRAGLILAGAGWLTSIVSLLVAAVSLVLRFNRARKTERQQIKWLASAGLLFALSTIAITVSSNAFTEIATIVTGAMIPIAGGIAILRYHRYDINVVVKRTLVYGSLSALLAGTYVAFVLLLQLALGSFVSGGGLAVALSTLAVAALFRPARNRIQAGVDRRFDRSHYDAERTLAAFTAQLRDTVDLDRLRGELTAVGTETMHPAHLSLWLKDER
jgi:hypothetical protein